jgi:hypothetical protein
MKSINTLSQNQSGNKRTLFFQRAEFVYYNLRHMVSRAIVILLSLKAIPTRYPRKVMTLEEGNEKLRRLLMNDHPFIVGRFGTVEMSVIVEAIKHGLGLGKIREREREMLQINAGFFPNDEQSIMKFARLCLRLGKDIDVLAVWSKLWNIRLESYVIRNYFPKSELSEFKFLEPYYMKNPWSVALKGKKVLVIHPYSETIESQYLKREYLFENKDLLPEFELTTIKAVQTIAGNQSGFETWFDALEYMYQKALTIDFDVALIGCGAYGLPLAVKLKQAGKKAIHMGGATQILFGIKGARWDNHPLISGLYNRYWVRPSAQEIPIGSEKVENGCYW